MRLSSGESAFPVSDRFAMVRRIGSGGMGVVYEALDRERQARVALKTLREDNSVNLYMLKQEFRLLTELSHPNLAQLYELICEGGQWFLTMELVEGVDFAAYARQGPARQARGGLCEAETVTGEISPLREPLAMPPLRTPDQFDRLRRALGQLTAGLRSLHEAGRLHRDIKPSNVLVTHDERVVLVDFGLVFDLRAQLSGRERSRLAGTIAYMPPEQMEGEQPGPAGDWYSVGVMLYEALTGRLPFRGGRAEILRDKRELEPLPSDLNPAAPHDLDHLCQSLLRIQPGHRPTGEQIERWLEQRSDAPVVAQAPLTGREELIAQLEEAYAAAGRSGPVAVFVEGQSGVGKSTLVRSFLEALPERKDAVVLEGRCFEMESVPYKGIDSVVDSLTRYLDTLPPVAAARLLPRDLWALTQVFPVLRRAQAAEETPSRHAGADLAEIRRRAFSALRELLARVGDHQRLVVAIDDLQWGDPDSATLLTEILRPPDPPPMVLIVCYRREDADRSVCVRTLRQAALEGAFSQRTLRIEPLDTGQCATLVGAMLPRSAGAGLAARIAADSGGNPYLAIELAKGIVARLREDAPDVREEDRPHLSLDSLLWDRVRRLAPAARRLLEVLAVAGQPLRAAVAWEVAHPEDQAPRILASLRAAHLLRASGPRVSDDLEVYHDRIREVVTARLSPEEKRQLHLRLGATLEAARGADPETIAVHLEAGGQSERAGRFFAEAAYAAQQALAFDRAARLYEKALALQRLTTTEALALRRRLADSLACAGRSVQAAELYAALANVQAGERAGELKALAAYHLCIGGEIEQGKRAFEETLGSIGMHLPASPARALVALAGERLRLRLRGLRFRQVEESAANPAALRIADLTWSVAGSLHMVDYYNASVFTAKSLRLALEAGEPGRIARALAWEAAYRRALPLGRKSAARFFDLSESLLRNLQQPYPRALLLIARAMAALLEMRWGQCHRQLGEAEDILASECVGAVGELALARLTRLIVLINLGLYHDLRQLSPAMLMDARARGDLFSATTIGTFPEPMNRMIADQPEAALRILETSLEQWPGRTYDAMVVKSIIARGWIYLYLNRVEEADELLDREWPRIKENGVLRNPVFGTVLEDLRARVALARAALGRDTGTAIAAARKAISALERRRTPCAAPMADSARAGLAIVAGDSASAAHYLESAAAHFDEMEMAIFAAHARRSLGQLIGGDRGDSMVREADEFMRKRGMVNPARSANAHSVTQVRQPLAMAGAAHA